MTDDIRLAFSFKDHRKRKKLNRLLDLSPSGTDYLINLWIATAENHPSGLLRGMDETDIALEAGWEGSPEDFVQALISVGWLEQNGDGVYLLHDWEEHQGYVIFSERRRLQARMANAKRHGNEALYLTLRDRFLATSQQTASPEPADSRELSQEGFPTDSTPDSQPTSLHSTTLKKDQPVADPSKHFKDKAPELEARLKAAGQQLGSKNPKDRKGFEPWKFIQAMFNKRYHPVAVTEVVEWIAVPKNWETIKDPWPFSEKSIKTRSGNYYERDHIDQATVEKNLFNGLIERLQRL